MDRVHNWLKQELQKAREGLKVSLGLVAVALGVAIIAMGAISIVKDIGWFAVIVSMGIVAAIIAIGRAWNQWIALRREELELKRKEYDERKNRIA